MYAPDSRWGRTIIFWQGGGGNWNIFKCKHFFNCGPWYKQFFCFSVFLQTLFFYLRTIYFSVHSLRKQVISKIPPPPLRQKTNTNSPSLRGERERKSCGPRIRVSRATVVCLVWETTHLHNGQLGNTRKLPLWIGGHYGEVAERGGEGGCKMTSSVSVLLGSNVFH